MDASNSKKVGKGGRVNIYIERGTGKNKERRKESRKERMRRMGIEGGRMEEEKEKEGYI